MSPIHPKSFYTAATLLPPLAWMGLIYLFSDQAQIPSAPAPLWDWLIKKSLHALAYAILVLLWYRALRGSRRGTSRGKGLTRAFLISLAWAASDEWHQRFVPGRHGRASDVLIDAAGALLAVFWLWRRDVPVAWSDDDQPDLG